MTVSQRRYLHFGLALGAAVTLLVVALDAAGWLAGFENYLYNQRARHCQTFTPAPTTQLVHLDIDDAALEEIGRWPWPRTRLAEVIDQLTHLGARVVAMDVLLTEPQDPEVRRAPDGTLEQVDHDATLAAAVRRAGSALVPISLEIQPQSPPTPARLAARDLFARQLLTPLADARAQLTAKYPDITDDDLLAARRDALVSRVAAEMARQPAPADEILQRLFPAAPDAPAVPPALRQTAAQAARAEESRALLRPLARPATDTAPDLLHASTGLMPVPPVARAAAHTGFVDHLPFADGVVRTIPLWIEHRGTLYPQLGLAMACAMTNTPIDSLQVDADGVVVPRPGTTAVRLPVSSYRSASLGRSVGDLMLIPWFGTDRWETMYDWPAHRASPQHVPIGLVYQAAQSRQAAIRNNAVVDRALRQLAEQSAVDEAKPFLDGSIPRDDIARRVNATARIIKEFDDAGWVAEFRKIPPQEMKDDERSWILAYDALVDARRANEQALQLESTLRDTFRGKAVLIGSVASGAADFVPTPLHAQCPGAVVHGAVFNAVMTGHVWRTAPAWVNVAVTLAVGLLVTAVVAATAPLPALLSTAGIVAGYLALNGFVLFDYADRVVAAAAPVTAAGLVWGVVTVARYVVERAERARITSRFRSYVDEQLVDYVLAHPERDIFEGEEQELTVAFTDMKGFTSLMERLGPRVVPLLNDYMGRMVPIIQKNQGIVNKFLGDGIMFFYGAPWPNHDHPIDAVDAILDMQLAVADFNRSLADQDLDPVAVRAGVTTGFMIVGDAGPRKRADYTVLGDAVNLASRLESANKFFGTAALISQRTRDLLDDRFLLRPVARVRVVGKTEWVMTHEPLARRSDATPDQLALAAATDQIVSAYLAADFPACARAATDAAARFGPHRLFTLYHDLATHHAKHPPDPFDGVVELSEK